MTMLRRLLPLALLPLALAPAAPLAAQDAYGYSGYGAAQNGYDTDGQSVDSIDVFFAPLSRYGRWIDSRYGRVWSPNVPRDWRPYTIGHWEEGPYGQTWRSDEPFGWAVFHFGRWAFDQQLGWLWSPDTTWGPGWVAWRDSDDVTGWAPLPPQASVGFAFGSGYGFNDWGYDQWYQPAWVYVPRGSLYSRSLRGVYLPANRNRDFWQHTRGVTRYDRVDGQVVNRSFGGGRDGRAFTPGDRRDWRSGETRRDGFDERRDGRRDVNRADLASPPLYGSTQRQVAPPAGYGQAPRDAGRSFDRRDGFVPGTPQRQFDRRDGFVPGTPQRQFDRRVVPSPAMSAAPATRQVRPAGSAAPGAAARTQPERAPPIMRT